MRLVRQLRPNVPRKPGAAGPMTSGCLILSRDSSAKGAVGAVPMCGQTFSGTRRLKPIEIAVTKRSTSTAEATLPTSSSVAWSDYHTARFRFSPAASS